MGYIISVICIIIIFLSILFTLIKFAINLYLKFTQRKKTIIQDNREVIFSIHIPTRAEPFPVVKKSIESILKQLNSKDELIIIDNNHTIKDDYEPLAAYCREHNIHFEHHDYIPGYKAGALNKALDSTSTEASHVFVVDCDYQLKENALERVRSLAAQNRHYGFIQFPQAYIKDDKGDVENELNKYFYFNLAINKYTSLGTGTLCCIKKDSLRRINGWPTKSITEDALFGLEIQKLGESGLFVQEIVGRGYLPKTIKDFYNQRKRWIYGNAEVFVEMIKSTKFNQLKLSNISQLTTWLNFTALTIFVHSLILLLSIIGYNLENILYLVYGHYFILFIIKAYEFSQHRIPIIRSLGALLIQWQFLTVASFHWLPVLLNHSKEFIRTPKLKKPNVSILNIPIFFLLLNILTLILVLDHAYLASLSIFFIILELLSIRVLLNNYKI